MSDFNYQPQYGMRRQSKPSVIPLKFGDGYEQRLQLGINGLLPSWSLTFHVTNADALTIVSFFETKGAVTSFTWTPVGKTEKRVVARQWDEVSYDWGTAINVVFDEVIA